MARTPHAEHPPAAPSWAADADADAAVAGSAAPPATGTTARMPRFPAGDVAPPRARHAWLRAGLRSLLGARERRPALQPPATPTSSWPDSFFDPGPGHPP